MALATRIAGIVFAAAAVLAGARAQNEPRPEGPLDEGPPWIGPVTPKGRNEAFVTGDGCAMCHSASRTSAAMRTATGDDVSPHGLWHASVMANSFRDPYWRATVEKEVALAPEKRAAIEATCVRCHAPMAHHTARLGEQPLPAVAALGNDALAEDGVSCTVCHQIRRRDLGTDATFDGNGNINLDRAIYGPYPNPSVLPMMRQIGFAAVHAEHVQSSAMCATCHTLRTAHAGPTFPEQTPYFEWRNSEFTNEPEPTATSRTCQECHMPELEGTRIARTPEGLDFMIQKRSPYRGHTFVGGNAFLLDLLAANREALGVTASPEALARMAFATRKQLAEQTVTVRIGEVVRRDGELQFWVRVDNLTGHKFPTGYPARRAWLHVLVRAGERVLFDSGGWTRDGRLVDVADPLRHEHVTLVTSPQHVLVWELIASDADGEPTTALTRMAHRAKDNRLLPRGYRPDGPHADDIAPVGIGCDVDFTPGGDAVDFAIPLPARTGRTSVVAWVRYQAIPPHWVDALRTVDAPECRSFVAMYEAADKTPETLAVDTRFEAR